MTIAVCNTCPDDETRFKVPWDEVGVALMEAHLREAHGLTRTGASDDKRFRPRR